MNLNTCPDSFEVTRFLDGEVSENRAREIRAHINECSRCQRESNSQKQLIEDIAAPIPELAKENTVQRILAGLDHSTESASRRSRLWIGSALAGAVAVAVVLMVMVRPDWLSSVGEPEFQARGPGYTAGLNALSKKVGIRLYALGPHLERIESEEVVSPDTALVASYRNLLDERVYLLLFVIDSRGTIHWLYPAYTHRSQDPSSIQLMPSQQEILLQDAVVLDDPSLGAARVVTVIGPEPVLVKEIESLDPGECSPAELQKRFLHADVRTFAITIQHH